MANSPVFGTQGTVRFTVRCDGEPIKSAFQLVSFAVNQQVNRIGKAELVFKASVTPGSEIREIDDDVFIPGTQISLAGGYGDEEDMLFEGLIVGMQLTIHEQDGLQFSVECRDFAYPMTQVESDEVHLDQSDDDIIQALLGNYATLSSEVRVGQFVYGNVVQFHCTDWDFMLHRAKIQGAVVVVDGQKIRVAPPTVGGDAVLKVTYGLDIIAFRAEVSAARQPAAVQARAWDPKTQSLLLAKSDRATLNDQGNIAPNQLAEVVEKSTRNVNVSVSDEQVLKARANAEQLWAGLSRISGSCTFVGNAQAKVDGLIELVGVGSRFNGHAYIGGVTHDLDDTGWTTTVSFGLPQEEWQQAPTSGEADTASSHGLHIGVVVQIHDDPMAENRIAIELPLLDRPSKPLWARLASGWASESYGTLSVPDVGDEVVVGFQQGNLAQAIVLGSLYSSKRLPEREWTAENNWHGLNTKSGIKIGLDDEEKAIHIETPGGIKILANDGEKSLSLEDMNGNRMSFSSDGIQLEAQKGIQIKSQSGITVEAAAKLEQSGKGGVGIEGTNVEIKADASATLKGNAKAELSASGQTVVKGAMVMIN